MSLASDLRLPHEKVVRSLRHTPFNIIARNDGKSGRISGAWNSLAGHALLTCLFIPFWLTAGWMTWELGLLMPL